MPTTVQSSRPCTSLETDKKILSKTFKTDEIATKILVFSKFYLHNTDFKALEYASFIYLSLYNTTSVVLSFIKNTNLIMTP